MEILVTSEQNDKLAKKPNVSFQQGKPSGTTIQINPGIVKQTIDGIGSSFTESAAFVLAHLDINERKKVMKMIYGQDGANFTLTRTHIGACDFCVKGRYSYADVKNDASLSHFTISPDKQGFSKEEFPGIMDTSFDLLPMIQEALAIKNSQADKELRIIASAWTAPSWMKDIDDWYIKGAPENNWCGTGGRLKPEYESVYADYIVKYFNAYEQEGVKIWGLTPVNEPHGNNGQWESMHFSPETQNEFIKNHLGPVLQASGHGDKKLLIYDQNRDGMEHWTDMIFRDEETSQYVYGIAVHWYESTNRVFDEAFNRVHEKFPDFAIIHTEGCIDDLGKDAPQGIEDPEKFKESGWFNNDSFWWNDNATDWAYTANWQGVNTHEHPIYTPVHRYARNIIVSLNNWVRGWVDWNIVLDHNGGPNHVGNFCGAPIMINVNTKEIHYTPIFYILAQFSKTIRPGDKAVQTLKYLDETVSDDDLHACATINANNVLSIQVLNTTKKPIDYKIQIGTQFAPVTIVPNAVQTVRIQL
jgi:glucosylceramidase